MKLMLAFLVALVAFLVIDAVWITTVVSDAYHREIGPLIIEEPRMAPAAAFYLGYVAVLVLLAVRPAVAAGTSRVAWVNGALLGAFAYGTYAFTNYAMLAEWTWHLVWTDIAWGAFLSSLVSGIAYLAIFRRRQPE